MAFGRGETIGVAYVRVLADGKDFDLARALGEDIEAAGEAGDDAGDEYSKRFAERVKRNGEIVDSIDGEWKKALADFDVDAATLHRLEDEVATAVAGSFDDEKIDISAEDMAERVSKRIGEKFARTGAIDLNFRKHIQAELDGIAKDTADFEKKWRASWDRSTGSISNGIDKSTEDMERLRKTIAGLNGDLGDAERHAKKFNDTWNDVGWAVEEVARKIKKATSGASKDNKHFSDSIAKFFGKGSRNDFLNIFGAIIGKVARFGEIVGGVAGKGVEKLIGLFSDAEGAGSAVGGMLTKVITGFVSFGVAIGAIFVVLGPLIAGITALGGALVALVGSLSFAAAAAIPVLVGGFAALAGAALVAFAAFKGFKDAPRLMRGLSDAMGPVTNALSVLERTAARHVFGGLTEALPLINTGLRGMQPLVAAVGDALGGLAVQVGKVFTSNAFQKFVDQMKQDLPGIILNFGQAMASGFQGMLGVIRASIPIVQQFSGWLAGISQTFSSWANSTTGQNWLGNFFARAATSAQAVWDTVTSLATVIGDLLSAGQGAGNGLFDDLTGVFDDMGAWLDAHPDALKDFFADAKDAAEALGGLVVAIFEDFATFNTDANRGAFVAVLHAATTAAKALADALGFINGLLGPIFSGLGKIIGPLSTLTKWTALGPISAFVQIKNAVTGTFDPLGNLKTKLDDATRAHMRHANAMVDNSQKMAQMKIATKEQAIALGVTVRAYEKGRTAAEDFGTAVKTAQRTQDPTHWGEAVSAALDEIASSAIDGTQAAKDFSDALNGLIDPGINLVRATDAWQQSLNDLTKDMVKNTKTIVGNSDAAIQNREAITDRVDNLRKMIEAQANAGVGEKHLTDHLAGGIDKLREHAVAIGVNRHDFNQLLSTYNLSPEFIDSLVRLHGSEEATGKIKGVQTTADKLGTTVVQPHINVIGAEEATNQALRVKAAVESIPLTWTTHIGISGDTNAFQRLGLGASGGMFTRATPMIIGEAGTEALVPLQRPLSMVDPSVRWLSALAQGKATEGLTGVKPGIDVGGITIITPSEDPGAVAQETINRLVGAVYF